MAVDVPRDLEPAHLAFVGTRVARVLIERRDAVGVVLDDGRIVRADEQVVVAAAALRTPQLLLLSGIGPAGQLREHGIDVVVDSPHVGKGLQDHPMVPAVWAVTSGRTLLDAQDEARRAYRLLARGPLSSLPTVGAVLPLPGDGPAPSVQGLLYLIGLDGTMQPLGQPAATVTVALLAPHSRGTVRLASGDAADEPVVDPAYLTDPRDLPRLRKGVEAIRDLMRAPALREFIGEGVFPSDDAVGPDLDDWIGANVQTQWHPTGTVRVGGDPDAPVDARLAVRGVERLAVADASVMPAVPRGNTHAPTIMVAERAASFLAG